MKIELKKPFEFEGKLYKEIEMDLDGLTGADMSAIKKQWQGAGNFSVVPATDTDFCALVCARAAKLPIEFFEQISARDYTQITTQVSGFLCA